MLTFAFSKKTVVEFSWIDCSLLSYQRGKNVWQEILGLECIPECWKSDITKSNNSKTETKQKAQNNINNNNNKNTTQSWAHFL